MKTLLTAAAVCFQLVGAGVSEAASVLYTTDFPGTATQPADWTVIAGGTATGTGTGWRIDDNGAYRYQNPNTGTNALSHYTGALEGGIAYNALTDFTIEATVRRSAGSVVGLAGRISSTDTFYHARIFTVNDLPSLQLYKFVSGTATQLGSTTPLDPAYVADSAWRLVMDFNGTTISTYAYDENNTLAGSIVATDTSIASGSAGVRTQATGRYESFTISIVPEPSSALLAGLGLLAAAAVRRRI
ncbi:PEP-CTERM sorting domain-containing protein [Luteolibacter sp. SL250]|uniref:PEP-CTERM sorting domain-containing protein n=1 Tax=Luteolibacter sp. SL250 TaxID=2995170 RepID=UPI00226F5808|nr:PEP-CTERM sorting domain-containing protein [Luteolibacter sp. SL250]WAC19435.1 PEP-CTERM sorting domain-containing protein [Luteolibacter sp. SL250]